MYDILNLHLSIIKCLIPLRIFKLLSLYAPPQREALSSILFACIWKYSDSTRVLPKASKDAINKLETLWILYISQCTNQTFAIDKLAQLLFFKGSIFHKKLILLMPWNRNNIIECQLPWNSVKYSKVLYYLPSLRKNLKD